MERFGKNLRIVFGSFKSSQRYSVTRQKFIDDKQKKIVKLAVVALAVLIVITVCLFSVWMTIGKGSNSGAKSKNDIDLLRQHRQDTENHVTGWIHDVYELRKDAEKGYTPSGTFDESTRRGYIMQEMVKKIAEIKNATLVELKSTSEHQSTFHEVVEDLCLPDIVCNEEIQNSPYRTLDGSCNNLYHPEWGMTGRPQRRSLPAAYTDDFGSPRMFGKSGDPLPSPRLISNIVHSPAGARHTDGHTTVMVMAFGQFLSHDIVATPMMDGHHSSVLKCCNEGPASHLSGPFEACFPVHVSSDDQHFHGSSCMTFTRSAPAICDKCEICGRDQINEMTSYIDASQVYGTSETASQLRTYSGGLLKSNPKGLLPQKTGGNCKIMKENQYCFNAGDGRVNVVPNLSTLHTIFVRLHNQIGHALSRINAHWDDEKLFQETRKILIAIMQNVVYKEYLPVILGDSHMQAYNLGTGSDFRRVYDSSLDATASNEFNAAAFRFGHMTVPDEQISLTDSYKQECVNNIEQTYHNPNMTFLYCDGMTRWMVHRKGLQPDGLFSGGVRNLLFLNEKNVSFDLAALNIQRGRDHGLPAYNHYRRLCNLPKITSEEFGRFGAPMGSFSAENADLFRKVYSHPDDIDLYSGGIKEIPVSRAQVGPTFACMIALEFQRLKIGDRFYFENPWAETGFTMNQLVSIKGLKFAKILCETMNISEIQPDVFRPITTSNKLKKCSDLSHIDLGLWKDEKI